MSNETNEVLAAAEARIAELERAIVAATSELASMRYAAAIAAERRARPTCAVHGCCERPRLGAALCYSHTPNENAAEKEGC